MKNLVQSTSFELFVGQPLRLPNSSHIHIVREGETIGEIAAYYNTTETDLLAENDLLSPIEESGEEPNFALLEAHSPVSLQPVLASVIVPLHNESKRVRRLCEALTKQTYSNIEVILIDNASTDHTPSLAAEYFPVLRYDQPNAQFSARNLGIRKAKGEYLLFTDGDCVPHSDWAEHLVRKLSEGYDVVAGDTHTPTWLDSRLCQAVIREAPRAWLRYFGDSVLCWFPTCNVAYRKSVFESLGLFREHHTGSDILFSVQAGHAGYACAIEPRALVKHEYAQSYGDIVRKWFRYGEKRRLEWHSLLACLLRVCLSPLRWLDQLIELAFDATPRDDLYSEVCLKSLVKVAHQTIDALGSAWHTIATARRMACCAQIATIPTLAKITQTRAHQPFDNALSKHSKVSVIVPLYNEECHVRALCESLKRQTLSNIEVLLVDNGSTDRTVDIASQYFPVIDCQEPGSYAARNVGISQATGDYLLFTDGDCIPHPKWVEQIITKLQQGFDIVAGHTIGVDFHNNVLCQEMVQGSMARMIYKGNHCRCYLPTCNVGYRREVFDRLGLFENTSGADTRFSQAAYNAGFSCIIHPKAVVYHHIADNYWDLCKRWFRHAAYRDLQWYGFIAAFLRIVFLPLSVTLAAIDQVFELEKLEMKQCQRILARLIRKAVSTFFFSSGAIYHTFSSPKRVY